MPTVSEFERLVAANLYMVIGTTDDDGAPWVTPVFFAPLGAERLYWVSSPDARHSRNLARRPSIAVTAFDSTVAIGRAEAAYLTAVAGLATPEETEPALAALNARLPAAKQMAEDDLAPRGPLGLYRADVRRRFVLVRGGDPVLGNDLDVSAEV